VAKLKFTTYRRIPHTHPSLYEYKLETNDFHISAIAGLVWQDLYAESPRGSLLALSAWLVEYDQPGFRIYVINIKTHDFKFTGRIPGFCKSLSWDENRFIWESSDGALGYV
jgi:hypothetical protein